jgi:hypothetical protein
MTRNRKSAAAALSLALLVSAVTGCSGTAKTTMSQDSAAAPAAVAKKKVVVEEPAVLTGKVMEVIQVQSYTYLLVEKDGKKGWAAIPATEVKVGDQVDLIPGVDMGLFTSTSLKRTFDSIHFSAGIKQPGDAAAGAAALPPGHPKTPGAPAAPAALPPGHPPTPVDAAALPPGHPKTDGVGKAAALAVPAEELVTGKVVETANAGGYTYVCLEKGGKKTWAAIPPTTVKVGQELSIYPGGEMTHFNSPSLNRTFDSIIFSPGVAVAAQSAPAAPAAPAAK